MIFVIFLAQFFGQYVVANIDKKDYEYFNISTGLSSSTNTYSQAYNYGQTHPTRDGGSWSGWCASLMWRSGNLPESSACPTAIDAYHKSKIISFDINSSPSGTMRQIVLALMFVILILFLLGAFHWWDIGSDGHVAMATTDGWSMMASCHVQKSWGDCIGITPVASYTSSTGAK